MASFLNPAFFAGNIKGQQDFSDWQQRQQANQQAIELRGLELKQAKDAMAQDAAVTDEVWNSLKDLAKSAPDTSTAQPQAPAPGQPSTPMAQLPPVPAAQPSNSDGALPPLPTPPAQPAAEQISPPPAQTPAGPQGLDLSKLSPQQQAFLARQNPQAFANGVQDFQKTSIAPYKSFNAPQPALPAEVAQIPPPPQINRSSSLNSMTLQDAVKMIDSQGAQPSKVKLAALTRMMPFLDQQAKQELAVMRQQLQGLNMENASMRIKQAQERIEQNRDKMDQGNYDQVIIDGKPFVFNKKTGDYSPAKGIDSTSTVTKPTTAKPESDTAKDGQSVEAMAWDYLIRGHNPPARGGAYEATMKEVAKIAKENGMSTRDLVSASADVKTKIAAKKNLEVRAQNMQRAENQLEAEIPVFEDAVKKVNTSSLPDMAKLELAARRRMGDPLITTMDQAADVIFKEFEGIITGNPGTLNVQDVQAAHEKYLAAQTPQQAQAAIDGMRRIISNARSGIEKTRKEIMSDINSSLGKPNKDTSTSQPVKISSDEDYNNLASGTEFIDPKGVRRRKP